MLCSQPIRAALNETFLMEVDSLVISGAASAIPTDELSDFFEDFEGLNRADPNALAITLAGKVQPPESRRQAGFSFSPTSSAPNNISSPQLSVISSTGRRRTTHWKPGLARL